jgi:hypothetical protein
MYQTACKETVPLFPLGYRRGIKYKVINDLLITESCKRNQRCDNDDDDRYRKFHISSCIDDPVKWMLN